MKFYKSEKVETLLICIRHGQADYTYEEDHGGDIAEGRLNAIGISTINTSADEICSLFTRYPFKKIQLVSSPKHRCLQSADILESMLAQHSIEVQRAVDVRLRDVKVIGPTEERAGSYIRWETDMIDGENWFSSWLRKSRDGMQFFPGEESPKDIQDRVSKILPTFTQSRAPVIFMCHEEIFHAVAMDLELHWTFPAYGEVWVLHNSEI